MSLPACVRRSTLSGFTFSPAFCSVFTCPYHHPAWGELWPRALTEPALHPELSWDREPPSPHPPDPLSPAGLPSPRVASSITQPLWMWKAVFPQARHLVPLHSPFPPEQVFEPLSPCLVVFRQTRSCVPFKIHFQTALFWRGGGGRSLRALAAGLLIHWVSGWQGLLLPLKLLSCQLSFGTHDSSVAPSKKEMKLT